jgi:hypothetical protein
MKNIWILLLFVSLGLEAQYNSTWVTLLDEWNFTKDTSVTVQSTYNYKWTLAIECDTLAGTLDGTFGIKCKFNGLNNWLYLCSDTSMAYGSCKQLFSSANLAKTISGNGIPGDSIRIELLHNNITSGTVTMKLKRY